MPRDLNTLFNPKSVAVIGASRTKEKVGAIVLKNILASGFKGKVYPVNPNATSIDNLTCYPNISSLPERCDLVLISLPPILAIESLRETGTAGIKNAVVFTAGFKETGPDGAQLEKQLIDISNQYQINLLGPNCLGFVNNSCPINTTFAQTPHQFGNLRFVSQSGAIASSLFDWCQLTSLGFSEFITLGNEAVLTENDILAYWQSPSYQPPVIPNSTGLSDNHPIGLYLEQITSGQEFLRLTSQISRRDPIFILKPGRSPAAARAMQSHTGAIAGEDAVLETAFRQSGITRCDGLEDLFYFARTFAWENPPTGPEVAVVSNAGGPAVAIADAVTSLGLTLAELDDQTRRNLIEKLPRTASILNPVDVLGDALADQYADATDTLLKEDKVKSLIALLTPQVMTQVERTADIIVKMSEKFHKPILCSFIGGGQVAGGEAILNKFKIPSFPFPELAVKALAALWQWEKWRQSSPIPNIPTPNSPNPVLSPSRDTPSITRILDTAATANQKALDNLESNEVLSSSGIPVVPTQAVSTTQEATNYAQKFGWPVVLKLSSPDILHKTDSKAVILNITDAARLESAFTVFQARLNQNIKIIIQKQVGPGIELIIGVKRDPTFGPVLMFGTGGTLAELIADRNLHLLPITSQIAAELIDNSKVGKLISGYRGNKPYDKGPLIDIILKLSALAQSYSKISQIEINPVILTYEGVWAVDGRVIL
jgi:acetyltransferase